jgi:Mg chelatase-like protein
VDIIAARSLIAIANHFRGTQVISRPQPAVHSPAGNLPDLSDIKGQESAKRALEVAAAGGHNLLMVGPPGSGKSMLAQRLPSILPRLQPKELLEVSMIASMAGELAGGKLTDRRPFRAPHHSASMAAMVGGGLRVRPGEVSLAHNGVLFLDEFPEFSPQALDALRQPLETGECAIARANHRVTYPARIQLVAAMNPCRCGMAGEPGYRCARGPRCQTDYQARISGPLLDRIDLRVDLLALQRLVRLALPTHGAVARGLAALPHRDGCLAGGCPQQVFREHRRHLHVQVDTIEQGPAQLALVAHYLVGRAPAVALLRAAPAARAGIHCTDELETCRKLRAMRRA